VAFWKKNLDSVPGSDLGSGKALSKQRSPVKEIIEPDDSPAFKEGSPGFQSGVSNLDDLVSERFGKIRSALGPGTVIQGKLSFDAPVRIDGKLSGEVFSSRVLIVGQTGRIDAQVQVASLIVMGSVTGSIKAAERIEVWKGGELNGDIHTPILVVQEGSWFSGSCSMPAVRNSGPLKTTP